MTFDRHPIFGIADPAYLWVVLGSAVATLLWVRRRLRLAAIAWQLRLPGARVYEEEPR